MLAVLDSTRANTGVVGLFQSVRSSTAALWSAPAPLSELDADPLGAANGAISRDGLTIYFVRSSHLLTATRATRSAAFGAPTQLSELNALGESDPWISSDQRTILFAALDAGGKQHIYSATR